MSEKSRVSVNPQLAEMLKECEVDEELHQVFADCVDRYTGLGFPFMKAVEMTLRLLVIGGVHIHERLSLQK